MKVADYYNSSYARSQLIADSNRVDRLRFIFKQVPKRMKILDIGCGPAADIDFLLRRDNEVHGIDISDKALSIAKERGVIVHRLDLSTCERLPFESSLFDMVILNDILEHLFLPFDLLIECFRLLKAQGILIASVPNHFFWKMRLRILFGKDIILPFHHESTQWDYFHIRFFTSKGFEELLDLTGFSVIERHYDQFIIVPRGLPRSLDL